MKQLIIPSAAAACMLLAACGGSAAAPATSPAVVSPDASKSIAASAAAASLATPVGGQAAPDPCSLLTVDSIATAYGTAFNAGQPSVGVDMDGAKEHDCEWQSTTAGRGAVIHVYVHTQTNADLPADGGISTIDGWLHQTRHYIGIKPMELTGFTGGSAFRNGSNEIDVLAKGVLLAVSSSSGHTSALPPLAAQAAASL